MVEYTEINNQKNHSQKDDGIDALGGIDYMAAALASINHKNLADSLSVITMKEDSAPTIEGDIEDILEATSLKIRNRFIKSIRTVPQWGYSRHMGCCSVKETK